MRLGFVHCNSKYNSISFVKGTVALFIPDKDLLLSINKTIADGTLLPLGVSLLAEGDNFCKAKGREIAEKRMLPTQCLLGSIEHRDLSQVYHFYCHISSPKRTDIPNPIKVSFGVSITEKSNHVKLLYADIIK